MQIEQKESQGSQFNDDMFAKNALGQIVRQVDVEPVV